MTTERKKVIYPLAMIDRIGQLTCEMFYLRNLYHEDEYDVTVVTYPPSTLPRTNKAVYTICMRGLHVVHSTDSEIVHLNLKHRNNSSLTSKTLSDGSEFVLLPYERLTDEYYRKYPRRGRKPQYLFSLSEEECQRGLGLREAFNIPKTAPIVTLHVREGGYLPHLSYHSFRDADIAAYVPAIEYLMARGFYVVRLGDRSMKQFLDPPPQLIDAPFHPAYDQLVDPYFTAVSRFYFGVSSGPMTLAVGFGIPVLATNIHFHRVMAADRGDPFIPKKYYSNKLGRYMTYEEIIRSPMLEFGMAEEFEAIGVQLVENSPDEILAAVKEIEMRVDGTGPSEEEIRRYKKLVRAIEAKAHYFRYLDPWPEPEGGARSLYTDLFWGNSLMSLSYLKENPEFLAHDCEYIEKVSAFSDNPFSEFMELVRTLIEKGEHHHAAWVSSLMVECCGGEPEAWRCRAEALRLVEKSAEAANAAERAVEVEKRARGEAVNGLTHRLSV